MAAAGAGHIPRDLPGSGRSWQTWTIIAEAGEQALGHGVCSQAALPDAPAASPISRNPEAPDGYADEPTAGSAIRYPPNAISQSMAG